MVKLVRHPQTKGRETDRLNLNHRATSRLYPFLGLAKPSSQKRSAQGFLRRAKIRTVDGMHLYTGRGIWKGRRWSEAASSKNRSSRVIIESAGSWYRQQKCCH